MFTSWQRFKMLPAIINDISISLNKYLHGAFKSQNSVKCKRPSVDGDRDPPLYPQFVVSDCCSTEYVSAGFLAPRGCSDGVVRKKAWTEIKPTFCGKSERNPGGKKYNIQQPSGNKYFPKIYFPAGHCRDSSLVNCQPLIYSHLYNENQTGWRNNEPCLKTQWSTTH